MDRTIRRKWKTLIGVSFFLLLQLLPLCAEEPFTISNSYQNLLSNREGTGMLDRIFLEIFTRMGMDLEIVFTPTEKSLPDTNAGIFDAEANRIAGMEKNFPNLRRVPEPNMIMEFVAFSKRPYPIDGWESIRNLDIGLVRGWKILEENTAGFPHVVRVPTEIELFNMVKKDRIDIALYSKLTGYATLREMGINGITHNKPPLEVREMYLYVHKKHSDLRPHIAHTLVEMKQDGTYQRILEEVGKEYGITF